MKKVLSILLAFLLLMTLTVPCFADESSDSRFTPSVTAKDAPRLSPLEGDVWAQIYRVSETGEEKLVELNEKDLSVTPYSKADEAGDIGTALKNAYQEIQNAESLSALNAELDQIAKALKEGYTAKNLVASDLFDVSIVNHDEAKSSLVETNTYIRLRFDIDKAADALNPVVMHRPSDELGWVAVPLANVVDNGDGTVTVKLDSLCPIAFLSAVAPVEDPSADPAPTPDKDDEPLSREFWWLLFAFGIVLFIIITMLIVALANSQRTYYEYKMKKEIEEKREKKKNKKHEENETPVEETVENVEKAPKKEKKSKKPKKSAKGAPAKVSTKNFVAAGVFTLYSALMVKLFLQSHNRKK